MPESRPNKIAVDGHFNWNGILRGLSVAAAVLCFLLGLSLLSQSFYVLGPETTTALQVAASNPFVGFFVGILLTAILQSSSTTTSFIIAMVGSGVLGDATSTDAITQAIPVVIGANIGTTVTSTIIALGHIAVRKEYRKAVSAATMHDFFNIFTAMLLFPLELLGGVLSQPAIFIADLIPLRPDAGGPFGLINWVIKPITGGIETFFGKFVSASVIPAIVIPLGLVVLFLTLRWIVYLLKNKVLQQDRKTLERTVFANKWRALGWGTLSTVVVQSSSVTTSLIVPLVATGRVSMKKAFPFVMGANIGTTTTGLLAALFVSGSNPHAALTIAIAHLIFNLIGVLLFQPVAHLRTIPVEMARRLGRATLRNRLFGILYILVLFFLIPFLMVILTS